MKREIPAWIAIIVVVAVIIIVALGYWLLTPKPSPGVGGQPVTKTAPPPGAQIHFKELKPSPSQAR